MTDAPGERSRLSSGRLLARNVGLAVVGQGCAIVLAFLAVPVLVHGLGTARFGVLTLAWLLIGYAGLFDLGLGRALTKLTSEKLGAGLGSEIPTLFWTSLVLLAGLGLVPLALVAGLAPWLARTVINMPPGLEGEATVAFVLLGLSIPAVLTGSALRGYLEAHQRFELTNGVTVAVSVLSYGGPALVVQFVPTLPAVVGVVVLSRYIAFAITLALALRVTPDLRAGGRVQRSLARPLLTYGGWVTTSSLGGAIMGSLDRFAIGAILSATAVAYYATPYQAVSQMLILSAALVGVLFPAFALNLGQDPGRIARLFGQGTRAALLALFPLALVVVTWAPEILHAWLGQRFADRSAFVMQVFAVGILFNGMAQVAFGLLQSGRPDLNAKLSLAELPFYVVGFVLAVHGFGIDGAAVAWSVRVSVDALLLAWLARRMVPAIAPVLRELAVLTAGAVTLLAIGLVLDGPIVKTVFVLLGLALYARLGWSHVLRAEERAMVLRRLPGRGSRPLAPPGAPMPDSSRR